MNNSNNSTDLSNPEEAMAWLVAFLKRPRSEKKLDNAADVTNPINIQRTICFPQPMWSASNQEVEVLFRQKTSAS